MPPTVTVTIGAPTPIVTAVVPAGVQTVTVYQSPDGVTVVVPSPTPAVTIFVYPNGAPAPSPTNTPSPNGSGSGAIRGTGTLCLPGDEDERVPGGDKLKTTPANEVTLCTSSSTASRLTSQMSSPSTSSCSSCPGTCSCFGAIAMQCGADLAAISCSLSSSSSSPGTRCAQLTRRADSADRPRVRDRAVRPAHRGLQHRCERGRCVVRRLRRSDDPGLVTPVGGIHSYPLGALPWCARCEADCADEQGLRHVVRATATAHRLAGRILIGGALTFAGFNTLARRRPPTP